jgi:hypothetical protein
LQCGKVAILVEASDFRQRYLSVCPRCPRCKKAQGVKLGGLNANRDAALYRAKKLASRFEELKERPAREVGPHSGET